MFEFTAYFYKNRTLIESAGQYKTNEILTAYLEYEFHDLKETLDKCKEYERRLHYPERGEENEEFDDVIQRAFMFYDRLDEKVALVKMVPGLDSGLLDYLLTGNDALIMECFGVGGLPAYEDEGILRIVEKHTAAGKFIVVTTQVQNEGSDLSVYSVGHGLKQNPLVLEGYDMTSEALYAKMMWILGQTKNPRNVAHLFYTPVAHDLLRCP